VLPKLLASAGYHTRNKDLITHSQDSVTGLPSLANPFISSDRSHSVIDLGFTWNLLDVGVGYFGAKQQSDRVLIASERRRKAMHLLIQDVRTAFWRTASAQMLKDDVTKTIKAAEEALDDSRKAEAERLRSPVDSLRYQRQVLENLRLLESIDQELSTGKVELAGLTNLPLSSEIKVIEPGDTLNSALLDMPVEKMEEQAIAQNADLREQFYNARIAVEETHKTLTKLFPGLSFNYNLNHDSDRYLVNNNWNEAGLQLSFNLFNLLTGPAQLDLAEAGVKLADQRRIATQMAVLTQVHIGRLQYAGAYRQFERADSIWNVDNKISRHIANSESAETQSKLESIANNTTAILSLLRRYQSMAQAEVAASRLEAAMGMEPEIGDVQTTSLAKLTGEIGKSLAKPQAKPIPAKAVVPVQVVETPPPIVDTKKEVTNTIERWLAAWSNRDADAYLAFYSPDFKTPEGKTRSAWEANRRKRLATPSAITVSAENLEVTQISNTEVSTTFRQTYQSNLLKNLCNKNLSMAKMENRWLINKETCMTINH